MTKRAVYLFLLGVLCVSTALAATKGEVTFKLDGRNAGANLSPTLPGTTGGYINFYINPNPLPDGSRGYFADVFWTEDGTNFHEIYGLLPASAVTFTRLSRPLQINITKNAFYIVPGSPFGDDGAFISLEGTFTPYTGPGYFTHSQSGRNSQTQVHLDGSAETTTFNGKGNAEGATFEGTFTSSGDTYNLSVKGPYPPANMFIQAGTQTHVITTP